MYLLYILEYHYYYDKQMICVPPLSFSPPASGEPSIYPDSHIETTPPPPFPHTLKPPKNNHTPPPRVRFASSSRFGRC